jgi:hypothetical protein
MSDERRKRTGFWLTASVAVSLLLGAYIGGYFWLSQKADFSRYGGGIVRDFKTRLLCRVYWPLGWSECKITGKELSHRRPSDKFDVTVAMPRPMVNENFFYP